MASHLLMPTAMFMASSKVRFSFFRSDLKIFSQVDTGLQRSLWYREIAYLNALFAGVELSALITLPNHFNYLFWIVVLPSIALVILYTSSFLTVFGHFISQLYRKIGSI